MRQARAGSIQSAVQDCYTEVGGIENVSDDLGLAKSTLSYGTEVSEKRPGGLGVNHLDKLARMHKPVAAILADHFARLAGGRFTAYDEPCPETTLSQHLACIVKECSEGELHLIGMMDGGCPHRARKELVEARDAIERAIAHIDRETQ